MVRNEINLSHRSNQLPRLVAEHPPLVLEIKIASIPHEHHAPHRIDLFEAFGLIVKKHQYPLPLDDLGLGLK